MANAANPVFRLRAVDETKAAFQSFERALKNAEKSTKSLSVSANFLTGVVKGLAGAFTLRALLNFEKDVINSVDSIAKLSKQIGISTEALSTLSFAADRSGSSADELQRGLIKLNSSLGRTATGSKETAAAFESIGLDPSTFKDTESAFRAIADAFARTEDGIGKTTVAGKIFGDELGARLIPLLNEGSAGFDKFAETARSFGLEVSSSAAKQAEAFNDALTDLNAAFKGIAISLLPAVTSLTNFINEILRGTQAAGGFLKAIQVYGTINPFRSVEGNITKIEEQLANLQTTAGAIEFQAQGGNVEETIKVLQLQLAKLRKDASQVIVGNLEAESPPGELTKKKVTLIDRGAQDKASKEAQKALDEERQAVIAYYRAREEEARKQLDLEVDAADERWKEENKIAEDALDEQIAAYEKAQESKKQADEILFDAWVRQQRKRLDGLTEEDKKAQDSLQKQKDLARDFGLTFTSALEDAIVNFKSLDDIIQGIVKDITRIAVRKGITEPLIGAVTGAIGGGGGGGFDFTEFIKGLGFEKGGIVRGLQPFAVGGIVSKPTPALVGEGSTAEAIVPLPDGRSIPAKITGMQPAQVSVNVYGVTDAQSFLRNNDQIAYATQRALSKAAARR